MKRTKEKENDEQHEMDSGMEPFADECYDENLHCFEPVESEEKENA